MLRCFAKPLLMVLGPVLMAFSIPALAQDSLQPVGSEGQRQPQLENPSDLVQEPPALLSPNPQPSVPLLSPDQLDNLVAPIALYPDPLLGQVLAATTYPLEIVEAQQWFEQNRSLGGAQLIDAARLENWDASIQALVAFPNVLAMLSRNVRWTTDLGNAFLAQPADVIAALQRLRSRAQQSGRLASTAQQVVTTQVQDGQAAIEVQPANPQMIYVPVYNPASVWGPPAYGTYPAIAYSPPQNYGYARPYGYGASSYGGYDYNGSYDYGGYGYNNGGIRFDPGVFVGALFTDLLKWGGWGWGLNWFSPVSLLLNSLFFNHFGFGSGGGFSGYNGGDFGFGISGNGSAYNQRIAWTHDSSHRLGIPYPNTLLASRFAGSAPGVSRTGAAGFTRGSPFSVDKPRSNTSGAFQRPYPARVSSFGGGREFEDQRALSQPNASSNSGPSRVPNQIASGAGGWHTFGGGRASTNFPFAAPSQGVAQDRFAGNSNQASLSPSYRGGSKVRASSQSYGGISGAPVESFRNPSNFGRSFSSAPSRALRSYYDGRSAPVANYPAPRESSRHFSFSVPRASPPRISTAHVSKPHSSGPRSSGQSFGSRGSRSGGGSHGSSHGGSHSRGSRRG